jgi:hypothetical protein
MKLEVKEDNKLEFEPITFTVTLESKEELLAWYARMNISYCEIKDKAEGAYFSGAVDRASNYKVWCLLYRKIIGS